MTRNEGGSMRRSLRAALLLAALVGVAVVPTTAGAQEPVAQEPVKGSVFVSLTPERVLDTRVGVGRSGALTAGESWNLSFASGSVPEDATAVLLNVTLTEGTQETYLSVQPSSDPLVLTSNVNATAGATEANLVSVGLGTDDAVRFFNAAGNAHVVVDLAGYFVTTPTPQQADKPFHSSFGSPSMLYVNQQTVIDTTFSADAHLAQVWFKVTNAANSGTNQVQCTFGGKSQTVELDGQETAVLTFAAAVANNVGLSCGPVGSASFTITEGELLILQVD